MRRVLAYIFAVLVCGIGVVRGQDNIPNLKLFVDPFFMAVKVISAEPISLNGLGFRVIFAEGAISTFLLQDRFDVLTLMEGTAQPEACFVFVLANRNPNLPDSCIKYPDRVFRREVAQADVFWYDFIAQRKRDVAITRNGQLTGVICSASASECPFIYIAPAPPTPTPHPGMVPKEHNTDWTPLIKSFDSIEMVLVPPGCFMMGEGQEAHQQCFDQPFWLDRYEVTNAQYGRPKEQGHPVEGVTWFEAYDFCQQRGARLPTEKEWEYAARGPDNLNYPWGDDFIKDNAIYLGNSNGQISPVGSKPKGQSWVGAFDLAGSIWEWTNSTYRPYPYIETDGRENFTEEVLPHVMRGGGKSTAETELSSSNRVSFLASLYSNGVGFRCARDFQPGDLTP